MGRGSGSPLRSLYVTETNTRMDRKVILVLLALLVLIDAKKGKIPKKFKKFTKSKTGCPCWWDLTKTDECACCKGKPEKVMQCGYPMHMYCHKKSDQGCPDKKFDYKTTLSTKGFPCFFDKTRTTDCAWCKKGATQCDGGDKCGSGCKGVIGDCYHIPNACDPNASCIETGKGHTCECNEGFTGNGIQCFDADGNLSQDPNKNVHVELSVDSSFNVFPYNGTFPNGEVLDSIIASMDAVNSACVDSSCSVTYETSETEF